MGWQLIFTSAPRTLKAGQSGFGTVAQSADFREALAQRLEQLSGYHRVSAAAAGSATHQPVISSYRVLDLRGTRYHVVSRMQDAGLDFTNRTNHLAHHLVFAPEELSTLPSPALILQRWDGWRQRWQEEPRLLNEADWGNLARLPRSTPLAIRAWRQWTGDAGCAALLLEKPYSQGCHLLLPSGGETQALDLFGESLQLLDPEGRSLARKWQFTFTTCLQEGDSANDFLWRACLEGTPGAKAVLRSSSSSLLAPSTIRPPTGALAELARHGRTATALRAPVVSPSSPASAPKTPVASPLTFRKPALSQPVRPIDRPIMMAEHGGLGEAGWSAGSRWRSPRVVGPAAGLVLLGVLLLAFVWPGWSSKHSTSSISTRPTPGHSEVAATPSSDSAPTVRPEITPPALRAKATVPSPNEPNLKSNRPDPNPSSETPAPSSAALASLEQLWHPVATLLVFRESAGRTDLAVQPEDDLNRLFKAIKERSAAAVEAGLRVGSLAAVLPKPATPTPFAADLSVNSATVRDPEGRVLEFEFGSLVTAGATPPGKLVFGYGMVTDASNCISVLFNSSVPSGGDFQPVRLLVLSPGPGSSPLRLDLSLLRANQPTLDASLQEPLLSRKKLVRFASPGLGFQLLPFVRTKATHLYASWPDKDDLPSLGAELDFAAVRGHLEQRIKLDEGELLTRLTRQAEVKQNLEQDHVLGWICGAGQPTNELHSFHSFLKHHPGKPALELYRRFLWTVLERLKAGGVICAQDVFEGLQSPEPTLQNQAINRYRNELIRALHQSNHAREEQKVQALALEYFTDKWRQLGTREGDPYLRWKEEHDQLAVEIAQLRKRLASLRSQLKETPRALAETASVSLYVTRGDMLRGGIPLLEFARFNHGPAQPKEGSR